MSYTWLFQLWNELPTIQSQILNRLDEPKNFVTLYYFVISCNQPSMTIKAQPALGPGSLGLDLGVGLDGLGPPAGVEDPQATLHIGQPRCEGGQVGVEGGGEVSWSKGANWDEKVIN